MKKICFLFPVLIFSTLIHGQPLNDSIYSRVATGKARAARYKYLVDTTIKQYLSEPLTDDNEGLWNDALWSLALLQYKDDFSRKKLGEAWKKAAGMPDYFQKNLLETTYSLYKTEFKEQALQLMQSTGSVAIFIRCAEYVLRADADNYIPIIAASVKSRFPRDTGMGLKILQQRMASWKKQVKPPPLTDIFSKDFLKGQTVLYSLQRINRNYAGIIVIRKPDGSFLTNADGSLFNTQQFAKAITAYPFYITNGNTPQGILRWTGFGISKLLYIGPTPNLQLTLPYEAKPAVFFADSGLINIGWQKAMYTSMLPDSWKAYEGIYESFYAGAMGRYDIIMHGTTIDPSFYKGQTYYPNTPSLGCLCSYEEWNSAGIRIKSNQQQITDALDSFDASNGYVVVVDINDEKRPVTIDDIKPYLP